MVKLDAKAIVQAHNLKPDGFRAQELARMIEEYRDVWEQVQAGSVDFLELPAHLRNAVSTFEYYTQEPQEAEKLEGVEAGEVKELTPLPI